ncbi:MAG: sigma-70 family RNA polymerase sigma factor [Pseudomonadota bacterium]|nr:MAG: sigma-70 family RNA polymerase sigma factor [Pseudomonadota bacterium]
MTPRQIQFEALVNAYSKDLYRYAVWLCRSPEVAEDLVQETFMRAWKALDSLQDPGSAKQWLITILRRENLRRFSRVQPEVQSLDEMDVERITGLDDEFVQHDDHSQNLGMEQALASLSLEYREPLLLQVLGGYSCEEIAQQLDIKPGAVMTRLFRARQKLRKCFEDEDIVTDSKVK